MGLFDGFVADTVSLARSSTVFQQAAAAILDADDHAMNIVNQIRRSGVEMKNNLSYVADVVQVAAQVTQQVTEAVESGRGGR